MCSRHAVDRDRRCRAGRRARPHPRGAPRRARRTPCAPSPRSGSATIVQLQTPSLSRSDASATRFHARLADALAVEVGEELRLRVARDGEQRAADAAELVVALDEPRRRVAELVVGGIRDVRPAYVLVGVLDVDERRACLVRRARDLARERCVLDERVDRQDLAGLQVHADLDGELGVLASGGRLRSTRRRTIASRASGLSAGRGAP